MHDNGRFPQDPDSIPDTEPIVPLSQQSQPNVIIRVELFRKAGDSRINRTEWTISAPAPGFLESGMAYTEFLGAAYDIGTAVIRAAIADYMHEQRQDQGGGGVAVEQTTVCQRCGEARNALEVRVYGAGQFCEECIAAMEADNRAVDEYYARLRAASPPPVSVDEQGVKHFDMRFRYPPPVRVMKATYQDWLYGKGDCGSRPALMRDLDARDGDKAGVLGW